MTTDRRAYKISPSNPGSDLAGETAAAMAAASIVFRRSNPAYSRELLQHAYQVCITPLFVALEVRKSSVFLGSAFVVGRLFCERKCF
jgi:hypothetical protein